MLLWRSALSELACLTSAATAPTRGRDTWVQRLERFARSGLTAAQLCDQEKLSQPAFYSWRRRLAADTDAHAAPAAESGDTNWLAVRLAASPDCVELALLPQRSS
jgi:hypothetical protein